MTAFLTVATRKGAAYLRADQVLAVSATEPGECMILITHGVTIAAVEPAEVVVGRLESFGRPGGAEPMREND